MSSQLPPKRFSDYHDSKYDSLRHLPWYRHLEVRREKVPMLQSALKQWIEFGSQSEVATVFGVDERELRDYRDFVEGRSRFAELDAKTKKTYQMVLDQSYDFFVDTAGNHSWSECIRSQAQLFGVNARPVIELWDIDPVFWPSHYRGAK